MVCTPSAFNGMSDEERRDVIGLLQDVTRDGGVHLVSAAATRVADSNFRRSTSAGRFRWNMTALFRPSFVARKGAA